MLFLLWRWYMQQLMPETLRAWRHKHGLTQEQAAEKIAEVLGKPVEPRTYQRWESGESFPRPKTYFQVLKMLDDIDANPHPQMAIMQLTESNKDEVEAVISKFRQRAYERAVAQNRAEKTD